MMVPIVLACAVFAFASPAFAVGGGSGSQSSQAGGGSGGDSHHGNSANSGVSGGGHGSSGGYSGHSDGGGETGGLRPEMITDHHRVPLTQDQLNSASRKRAMENARTREEAEQRDFHLSPGQGINCCNHGGWQPGGLDGGRDW